MASIEFLYRANCANSLFGRETFRHIDGVCNVENDRVWVPSGAEANKNGGVMSRRKFPEKSDGTCSKGITPLVLFEESTLDHHRYRKEVLPVALT